MRVIDWQRGLALALGIGMCCGAVGDEGAASAARSAAPGCGANDLLCQGFVAPARSARPRVWWHWMNGNVDVAGIRADLAWMERIGLGGFVLVEGGLPGAQRVTQPVRFDTPAWREAVRTAAQEAARLGLEMGINTSPGWSISGGPWVRPADAMRKLVWSQVDVTGGRLVRLQLPAPPRTAGPFLDVADGEGHTEAEAFYEDAAVVAVRLPKGWGVAEPVHVTSSQGAMAAGALLDGRHDHGQLLKPEGATHQAWITYQLAQRQTVRSVQVGLPGPRGFGAPPAPRVQLQASDDGQQWRTVAVLPASQSPVRTAAFAPVHAAWFRLWLDRPQGAQGMPPVAPGAVQLPLPPPSIDYTVTEWRLHHEARVHHAEDKAGFGTVADYYAVATPASAVGTTPRLRDVVNLRAHVDRHGLLQWRAPAGQWRVLRLGASLTGHRNGPAPAEATGLEVDKLDADRVRGFIDTYLGFFERAVGPQLIGARGLRVLQADSIESGQQNWTTRLPEQFARRRGYTMTRWFPALTGIVIDSAEATDRFLDDFRRTVGELLAEAHYGTLADAAHRRGLRFQAEALEDHRPQLGDDEAMRRFADVPMGAMWQLDATGTPRPTFVADLRGAASVAHVWGRPWVAAETFTSFGSPYTASPKDLKTTADLAFALGVNQINIHTSPHQPAQVRAPGMALAVQLGQYFSRHETWGEMAGPWIDYLARSSHLLQQGRFHADIAYFYGEEAPVTGLFGAQAQQDVPPGYGVDLIGRDGLLQRLQVINGQLGTPDGPGYAVLMLGGSSAHMSWPVLQRVAQLVSQGATVVGRAPERIGMAGSAGAFAALRERLWGKACSPGERRRVGRGTVICGDELAAALQQIGLAPDWQLQSASPARGESLSPPAVLHRRLPDGELYFVANTSASAWQGDFSMRVGARERGLGVSLWQAQQGTRVPLAFEQRAQRTQVPLQLAAGDAVFVVLRPQQSDGASPVPRQQGPQTVVPLHGPWQVQFESGRGAPEASQSWPALQSYTRSDVAGIHYFSGRATYSHGLQWLPPSGRGGNAWLDLGQVAEVARVHVNGRLMGTAWRAPYRVDITAALVAGDNLIEIEVANVWANRLIGDVQPGQVTVAQTVAPAYQPEAPLRDAGLLGPVRVIWQPMAP